MTQWRGTLKKKTAPPVVVYLVLTLSVACTGYLWYLLLKPMPEQPVVLVPGEFPQKQAPEEVEKPETTDETPAPRPPASIYPIILTASQATKIDVVVNKKHRLPDTYVPTLTTFRGASLRPEASTALETLISDAEAQGHSAKIVSAYRSYSTQVSVYNNFVNQYGQSQADTFSARPGHSEHQTGLAVDLGNADGSCELEICFGTTAFGSWLRSNAHLYGYIVRYPEGKELLTGYQYEPWHMRYVGVDIADGIVRTSKTLDEYLNIPAGGY